MRRKVAAAALAAALVLTGCGGTDDSANTTTAADETAAATTEPAQAEDATSSETSADAADDTVTEQTTGDEERAATGSVELDISERHPNGTVLDITGVTIEDRTVTVAAEFFNGGTKDIDISIEGGRSIILTDEADAQYPFVKPADAQFDKLTIAPGESIGGDWTFLGRVGDSAALTLTVNMWSHSNSPPNQWDSTTTPEFSVQLPLQ